MRFPGVINENGSLGCIMAHLNAMKEFGPGLNLIMEDDCQFIQPWEVVERAISQLPEKWDCLYVGAMLHKPLTAYSPNLYKLYWGWTNHAIIYNGTRVSEYMIKHGPVEINRVRRNIDTWMVYNVQDVFDCYIVSPLVAIQRESHSNITNRVRNYQMQEHYSKYTKKALE